MKSASTSFFRTWPAAETLLRVHPVMLNLIFANYIRVLLLHFLAKGVAQESYLFIDTSFGCRLGSNSLEMSPIKKREMTKYE